jgi:uncharacterized membrane protein YczE
MSATVDTADTADTAATANPADAADFMAIADGPDASATTARSRPMALRMLQLLVGLSLYGASSGLQVRSGLGLDPWDVFHQGISERLHWQLGLVVIVVGAVVLLGWIPLRQRPGLGTVLNVVLVGSALGATMAVLPPAGAMAERVALLVGGIVLCGVATGLYITAGLGAGPRDGFALGLAARTGKSVRLIRTILELSVLAVGFLLGGTVGIGTLAFAVTIGPISQFFLRLFGPSRAA